MSELFDSLRRRQQQPAGATRRPAAQGDAVLATLGYAPARGAQGSRLLLAGAIVAGALALSLAGWRMRAQGDDQPVHSQVLERTSIPPASAPPSSARPGSQAAPAPQTVPPPLVVTPPPALEAAEPGGLPVVRQLRPERTTSAPATPSPVARPGENHGAAPAAALPAGLPGRVPVDAGASRNPADDGPSEPMRLALYHHRAGDFENALIQYRAVLQQNELNAPAHNNLGMLYQQKGLLDEAAREFERAILIDPRYVLAHNNHGVTLLRQGKVEAAAAEFQAVIKLDPRNIDAIVNLALAQKEAQQPGLATSTLLRALGMSPQSAPAHYNLAVLYDETGERALAIEHYRSFLDTAGAEHAAHAQQVRARIDTLSKR